MRHYFSPASTMAGLGLSVLARATPGALLTSTCFAHAFAATYRSAGILAKQLSPVATPANFRLGIAPLTAGHKHITTTMKYMHLSPADRESAVHLLDKAR
jgi:hypothetical protein